jgi:hypothetical protein
LLGRHQATLNLLKLKRLTLSRATHGNIYTNVAHSSNNRNNSTLLFIGLHKTAPKRKKERKKKKRKHARHVKKKAEVKIEREVVKQMYFYQSTTK